MSNSKWSKPSTGLKIVPIVTAKETFSPGDAMRDIYTHGIITSDFVLITGDLVSNVRIDEVVRVHKERRKTNKDAIMTMVVKESGAHHRTRSKGDSAVFVLDPKTSECLHYEPVTGYPPKKYANIPREILVEHPEVDLRNDLIDCSIDVCSVEVPSLFQDNFDYGDIRRDFVHGVLTSDLLMKNIYCYIAKDGYAARVKDTKSYDSIRLVTTPSCLLSSTNPTFSKDILSRWTFPLVPDDNHPAGHSYEHLRGNKYTAADGSVVLSRTCKIGNQTLIGSKSQIADNAQIVASVLGQRCVIGAGSVVHNSYLFDGVVIGPNCVIEYSIIGAGVQIKEMSRVERGCLIADKVTIGPQARLGPFQKLLKKCQDDRDDRDEEETEEDDDDDDEADGKEEEDDDDESEEEDGGSDYEEVEANQDPAALEKLGPESNAVIWPEPKIDEDDGIDEVEHPNNQRLMRIGDDASDLELSDPGSVTSSESESESESDSEDEDRIGGPSPTSSSTSLPLSAPSNLVAQADSAALSEFQQEVTQSLDRAFAEGHSVDNAAVELKTLRMASNVPLRMVREAVVAAVVSRIKIVEGGGPPQRQEIAAMINRWGGLIDKIGGVDAVETIEILQEYCALSPRLPLFGQILAALYQDDIVEEDDIRNWHEKPGAQGEGVTPASQENFKKCWTVGAHMIKQFDEQESEEESDDDEEEDSEGENNVKPATPVTPQQPGSVKVTPQATSEDDEGEEEEEDDDEDDGSEEEEEESE
ncbi:hypothetical protein J3R83DRAFT_4762 [Lanmaoa asiatica]|nr:hypothetical protein J3R83DRAFT_4762 [Lanmaoa asiatica]